MKQAKVPLAITGNAGTANLLVDPKFANPYMTRFTTAIPQFTGTVADWAIKQGYKKAVLVASDYAGGLQIGDATAWAYVNAGGSIIQELYPAQGSKDFGPYLAQLDKSADVILTFIPGTDGLRFIQQFNDYVPQHKAPIVDIGNVIASGPNIAQLQDKAVGIIGSADWTEGIDTPLNQAFLKLFAQKYPGRLISRDVAEGYNGAQAVTAAMQKVNGNVEDTTAFLHALYAVDMDTIKGHIRLNQDHDVIENVYIFKITKSGSQYNRQILATYKDADPFFGIGRAKGATFPYGTLKGKWVGMTKAKLP